MNKGERFEITLPIGGKDVTVTSIILDSIRHYYESGGASWMCFTYVCYAKGWLITCEQIVDYVPGYGCYEKEVPGEIKLLTIIGQMKNLLNLK